MRLFDAFKAFFNVLFGCRQACAKQQPDSILKTLQEKSRLIDFLKEDISTYSDSDIGAAVRQIHKDAGLALEEVVGIRPIVEQDEGADITITVGYDAHEIKLVGEATGHGPYGGKVRHRGWKGIKIPGILHPAEVEVKK